MLRPSAFFLALALALPGWAQAAAEPADPAYWEITGVEGGATVNLRKGPSTGEAVVAELARGTLLKNLGCTGDGARSLVPGRARRRRRRRLGRGALPRGPRRGARRRADDRRPRPLGRHRRRRGARPRTGRGRGGAAGAGRDRRLQPARPAGTILPGGPARRRGRRGRDHRDLPRRLRAHPRLRRRRRRRSDVFSPDPTDEVTATRADGKTVVEINGVERIEVPDALAGR